ncbi:MAG: UDP-N-acetylglucosamine 2-epimerase, partial [Candidatus Thermoplasmatota archaeon]|nr:UDP-N-acetylglucosamine 2-epimerase [Candidatus Thermoplasmatota archaeon]
LTGDVMVDSLLFNKEIAEKESHILEDLDIEPGKYLVATIHRASNTDDKTNLTNIVQAFSELDENIVFPLHPRTEKFLKQFGLYYKLKDSVILTQPLGFFDFIKLMNNSRMILTDSGGVQKEAYVLKVPCVTLRENTEWVETIEDGWNVLVCADKFKIIDTVSDFVPSLENHRERFGKGKASEKIADIISIGGR